QLLRSPRSIPTVILPASPFLRRVTLPTSLVRLVFGRADRNETVIIFFMAGLLVCTHWSAPTREHIASPRGDRPSHSICLLLRPRRQARRPAPPTPRTQPPWSRSGSPCART